MTERDASLGLGAGRLDALRVRATRDLVLVRHGETDWNRQWRLQGMRDVPINQTGIDQMGVSGASIARALGNRSQRRAPALWSSPVLRAHQSAEVVARCIEASCDIEAPPVRTHDGLREFDTGRFTGREIRTLQDDPDWMAYLADPANGRFPDGESVPEVRVRALEALREILSDDADTSIVVTHGGVIRLLAIELLGIPDANHHRFQVANASITHVRLMPPDRLRLMALNLTPHLQPLL